MDPSKLRDTLRALMPDMIRDLRALAREHAPEAAASREAGYKITNLADEAVVRIYDEIWEFGVNARDLVADLDAITAPAIRVDINSPGGDVFDGIAIYNALRNHPATVTTRVDGLAGSIASVIAQAGDRRIMQPSSQMVIHNAHALSIGDNRIHSEVADILRQQDGIIAGIYGSRSGRDADAFRPLMDAETWLTAERAVAEGLADEIVEPAAKQPENRAPLADQITAAVSAVSDAIASAEQVSAVRAEVGKGLSASITASLSGLRDEVVRLDGLLHPLNESGGDAADVWTVEELAVWRARLTVAARTVA